MNRTIIFAHFDRDNIIDNYIITYLEELKKFCNNIIFVSDCNLLENEINKISHLITDFIAQKHNEYDFGSYKIGYQLLVAKHPQILEKTDELLFVNDSCYCIGSFEKVFSTEITKDIDAWGLTEGYDHSFSINSYYLQSYFIALRPAVFKERFFIDFVNSITSLANKDEIVKRYELGLSQLMLKNHKKLFAVFNISQINDFIFKNSPYLIDETLTITGTLNNNSNIKSTILKYQLLLINEPNHIHSDKFLVLAYMKLPVIKRRIISEYSDLGSYLVFFWAKIISIAFPQFDINQIFLHNHRIGNALKDADLASDLKYIQQALTISHRRFYSYIFYGFCVFIYAFPYLGSILFKPKKIKKFLYKIILRFNLI